MTDTALFEPTGTHPTKPRIWVERRGRGRLGGSGMMLALIQRARFHGRRVKPLDADFKSRTLSNYYPATGANGEPVPDGASAPQTRDVTGFKAWLLDELNAAHADGIARVLDVSGGSREIDEMMTDLDLAEFCDEFGIRLLSLCLLGPDREDFLHLLEAVATSSIRPRNLLVAFNEGMLRGGNAETVFSAIKASQDFRDLERAGARAMFVHRLPCMTELRDRRDDFYAVAAGRRVDDRLPPATQIHMTRKWLAQNEAEFKRLQIEDRLP